MKISVVIAAFRGEKYIAEQLKSLFAQTRIPDEILIGDDSPDNGTFEVIESLRSQATCPVRYIKNTPAKGITGNFSFLLERASGEILFICDQDDFWLPEKLERMSNEFQNRPDCGMVFCNSAIADESLHKLGYSTADVNHYTPKDAEKLNHGQWTFHELLKSAKPHGHNLAVRRTLIPLICPIPETVISYDYWISSIAFLTGPVHWVYQDLTLYRQHGSNQSEQTPPQTPWERFRFLLQKKERHAEELNLCIRIPEEIRRRLAEKQIRLTEHQEAVFTGYLQYFNARRDLLRMKIPLHLFAIVRIKGYFRYGFGWRTILRDVLFGWKRNVHRNRSSGTGQ